MNIGQIIESAAAKGAANAKNNRRATFEYKPISIVGGGRTLDIYFLIEIHGMMIRYTGIIQNESVVEIIGRKAFDKMGLFLNEITWDQKWAIFEGCMDSLTPKIIKPC